MGSWQQTESQQAPPAPEPAMEDALALQPLISEAVSQPKAMLRNVNADLAVPNGWHDDASANGKTAGWMSAGPTSHVPMHDAHPETNLLPGSYSGSQTPAGMYAMPEAVHAWATDGAVSTSLGSDAEFAQAPMGRRSHRTFHQPSAPLTNGFAPGVSQPYPPQPKSGSLHPHLANAGYSGSPSDSNHWQESASQPPPGLSQVVRPPGFGWAGGEVTASARQPTSMREQAPSANLGLPSYALSAYHKQPHAQPQGHGYQGHSQHRHALPNASARLTSSLQSLDLATDSWQSQRSGQSQHLSSQRWGRGGRPGADGGSATQPPSARVSPERMREGHGEPDSHPPLASASASMGYRPHKVSAGMRHPAYPAYPASSTLPDTYAEQGLRPGPAVVRQYDNRHDNGNMKVPHAAVEAAMLASSAQMAGGYQEPKPVLPDWQRPAPLQSRDLAAATDLERLLQQLTPVLSENSQNGGHLTLVSYWLPHSCSPANSRWATLTAISISPCCCLTSMCVLLLLTTLIVLQCCLCPVACLHYKLTIHPLITLCVWLQLE